jgi:hypothetical protein
MNERRAVLAQVWGVIFRLSPPPFIPPRCRGAFTALLFHDLNLLLYKKQFPAMRQLPAIVDPGR